MTHVFFFKVKGFLKTTHEFPIIKLNIQISQSNMTCNKCHRHVFGTGGVPNPSSFLVCLQVISSYSYLIEPKAVGGLKWSQQVVITSQQVKSNRKQGGIQITGSFICAVRDTREVSAASRCSAVFPLPQLPSRLCANPLWPSSRFQ